MHSVVVALTIVIYDGGGSDQALINLNNGVFAAEKEEEKAEQTIAS